MPKRPCIHRDQNGACIRYALPNESRCFEQHREYERSHIGPSQTVVRTARWKRLRAKLIRERRRADGTWRCQLCGKLIDDAKLIEVDHRVPVAEDPSLA